MFNSNNQQLLQRLIKQSNPRRTAVTSKCSRLLSVYLDGADMCFSKLFIRNTHMSIHRPTVSSAEFLLGLGRIRQKTWELQKTYRSNPAEE
jgi:hypothetical protein